MTPNPSTNMLMMASAAMLRAMRDKLGWSQAQLASEVGVAMATIQRAEVGASGMKLETWVNVSRCAGLKASTSLRLAEEVARRMAARLVAEDLVHFEAMAPRDQVADMVRLAKQVLAEHRAAQLQA